MLDATTHLTHTRRIFNPSSNRERLGSSRNKIMSGVHKKMSDVNSGSHAFEKQRQTYGLIDVVFFHYMLYLYNRET